MAFATVRARTNSRTTSDGTSHSVSLGLTPNANDLLVIAVTFDGTPAITWPANWTQIVAPTASGTSTTEVRYKRASGEGSSISLTTDASEQMEATAWVFDATTGGTPEAAAATGSSSTPNPPSSSPSWGAKDTTWLAYTGINTERTVSAYPGSYTQTSTQSSSSSGAVTMARAERQLNAASEDPGTFTIDTSESWVAVTIAVNAVTLSQAVADTLALADSLAMKMGKVLTESATIAEAFALKTGKVLTDAASLADAVSAVLVRTVSITEALSIVDALSVKVGKVISETATLTDTAQALLMRLPSIQTRYAPRPLITLTIGAATKRYSTETLAVPASGYGEAQYGEAQYGES